MHKVETNDNHYITKERKYARGKKGRKNKKYLHYLQTAGGGGLFEAKNKLTLLTFNYIIPITHVPLLTLNYKY